MKYYSTNKQAPVASLEEAVVKGLAGDKGLYMPEYIDSLDEEVIANKCSLLAKLLQHSENIAWCSAWIGLHHHIALAAEPVLCKVYEQFSKCHNIKSLHGTYPPYNLK